MIKVCKLYIDNQPFKFNVEGEFFWGTNELLYKEKDNIISKMPWKDEGFGVIEAFDKQSFLKLRTSIKKNIINAFKLNNIDFDEEAFTLEKYHEVINSDVLHNKVIDITRNLENSDFDLDIEVLVEKFGNILGYKLTSWIEELQKSHIQIRISRPNSLDINPPHRDGYLSYWEDIINVWIPIVGCNEKASLPVFPKSHIIPENQILRTKSKGAKINGNVYYVPCILETNKGTINMIRPKIKYGQAMIFSPYLIHGAAVNQNEDITRISLELRFPRVKK